MTSTSSFRQSRTSLVAQSCVALTAIALTGVAACSVADEHETAGTSESAYVSRSCGVRANDGWIAQSLNTKLTSRLAGAMTPERVACARTVVRTTLGRGLGPYAARIAVATTIVETGIENITVAVDYDSLGLFQQRPSAGWGQPFQLIDPVYATNAFLNAMLQTYGNGWRNLPLGVVAQGVQGSAFPDRYQFEAGDAQLIVDAVGGTSCPGAAGTTVGAIDDEYQQLGACNSVLGAPITDELPAASRGGRFNHFQRGSIYWTQETGAHEVHGDIRGTWEKLDWERGPLGYPISDETTTPDSIGRYNVFEGGSIYWTEKTGAHEVRGLIRDKWAELGWEVGALGYPTTGEVALDDGARSEFEHGAITWTRSTGAVTVETDQDGDAGPRAKDGGM